MLLSLYGELASILELSGFRNDEPRRFTGGVSVSLVAGARFGHCFREMTEAFITR